LRTVRKGRRGEYLPRPKEQGEKAYLGQGSTSKNVGGKVGGLGGRFWKRTPGDA